MVLVVSTLVVGGGNYLGKFEQQPAPATQATGDQP